MWVEVEGEEPPNPRRCVIGWGWGGGQCKGPRFASRAGLLQASGLLSVSVFLVHACGGTCNSSTARVAWPAASDTVLAPAEASRCRVSRRICVFSSTCPQPTASPALAAALPNPTNSTAIHWPRRENGASSCPITSHCSWMPPRALHK